MSHVQLFFDQSFLVQNFDWNATQVLHKINFLISFLTVEIKHDDEIKEEIQELDPLSTESSVPINPECTTPIPDDIKILEPIDPLGLQAVQPSTSSCNMNHKNDDKPPNKSRSTSRTTSASSVSPIPELKHQQEIVSTKRQTTHEQPTEPAKKHRSSVEEFGTHEQVPIVKFPNIIFVQPSIKFNEVSLENLRAHLNRHARTILAAKKSGETKLLHVQKFSTLLLDKTKIRYKVICDSSKKKRFPIYVEEAAFVHSQILKEIEEGVCDFSDKIVMIEPNDDVVPTQLYVFEATPLIKWP